MKKLYYEEEHGEFYWVDEKPKTIVIEWAEKLQSDGTPLDQNVNQGVVAKSNPYKREMLLRKDNKGQHCLKQNDEDGILVYPFRAGIPFSLEPATMVHITSEIADCVRWGVSGSYYENLKQYVA